MSQQAEAERERRARIISADGEYQPSKKLAQAAAVMAADPAALPLRLPQTVVEVAAEKNGTLVMPGPVELLRFFDRAAPATGHPQPSTTGAQDTDTPLSVARTTGPHSAGEPARQRRHDHAAMTTPLNAARKHQPPSKNAAPVLTTAGLRREPAAARAHRTGKQPLLAGLAPPWRTILSARRRPGRASSLPAAAALTTPRTVHVRHGPIGYAGGGRGELGYSLVHAYGAVFDHPGLLAGGRGGGGDPFMVHQELAATLDQVLDDIATIQHDARHGAAASRPAWPMIVLRTPKGWTGPKEVDGPPAEGTWRAHQVPLAETRTNATHRAQLEQWMRSYRPEELFDATGQLIAGLHALVPEGARRMSANPHADGGLLLVTVDARLPWLRRAGGPPGSGVQRGHPCCGHVPA
jgi:XFP-like protein